jgi:hypothetical protein
MLDADILIDLVRRHPPATAWFAGLSGAPHVSGIAALELAYGVQNATELRAVQRFLREFPLVWPSQADMRRALHDYARLRLSSGLGLMDALIAATAVGRGEVLATFNVRHFRAVPDLQLVQPYVR